MDQQQLRDCIAFIQRAENLKNTLRSAYTSMGRQESSAEHSWRLCLLLMVLADQFEGVHLEKLLRMAVIHDLGEAVCGDIPAVSQSGEEGKSGVEREAMQELCQELPESIASAFLELWDEYEGGESAEARIVKGLDKMETIIQHNQGLNPDSFDYGFNLSYGLEWTQTHPLLEQMRAVLDEATRARAQKSSRSSGHDDARLCTD